MYPTHVLPLVFGRTYASRADDASTLGPRWMHTFGSHLRFESNGDVVWVQDDLRTARFTLTSPGTWRAPAGYFERLVPRAGAHSDDRDQQFNRPDLQYTDRFGRRQYIEYDTPASTRGGPHRGRILANDPNGNVTLKTVP